MQILKNAGIVKMRKEGTFVYYYLDPEDGVIDQMITLFTDIKYIMDRAPDRRGEDD